MSAELITYCFAAMYLMSGLGTIVVLFSTTDYGTRLDGNLRFLCGMFLMMSCVGLWAALVRDHYSPELLIIATAWALPTIWESLLLVTPPMYYSSEYSHGLPPARQ